MNFDDLSNKMEMIQITRTSRALQPKQMAWEKKDELQNQFRDCYFSRLKKMKKRFMYLPQIVPISQVTKTNKQNVFIMGIFKRIENARIRVFQNGYSMKYNSSKQLLYSSKDELELEDESSKIRISLCQNCVLNGLHITDNDLPFGVIIAVRGQYKFTPNKFFVLQVYFPSIAMQRPLREKQERSFIVVSQATEKHLQKLIQTLNSYVMDYSKLLIPLGVIICGFRKCALNDFRKINQLLGQLQKSTDVMVMSSAASKYDHNLEHSIYPIQPYSRIIFKQSASKIELCHNPKLFQINQTLTVGVFSSLIIQDFQRNCSFAQDSLEIAKTLIKFGHYCPTSPFSLRSLSFLEDPFIIQELPHVFIITPTDHFQAEKFQIENQNVLIICLPAEEFIAVNSQMAQVIIL